MSGSSNIILRAENASCQPALGDIGPLSLACEDRALTLLSGGDGCGKNILLRMLGLLEVPAAGEIFFRNMPTRDLSGEARAGLRNLHFGYLFAEPFLLPSLSVVENIAMPLLKISVVSSDEAHTRTKEMLDFIGLPNAMEYQIDELSMFEQHKVALARALVNRPGVLIVENIDTALSGDDLHRFVEILLRARTEFETTPIVTARSEAAVPAADCVIRMQSNMLVEVPNTAVKKGGAAA